MGVLMMHIDAKKNENVIRHIEAITQSDPHLIFCSARPNLPLMVTTTNKLVKFNTFYCLDGPQLKFKDSSSRMELIYRLGTFEIFGKTWQDK